METTYQRFDEDAKKTKINKVTLGLLIVTCILLVAVSIIATIYGIRVNNNSKKTNIEYCTTTECLKLAADLSNTINTSVDPCHDFYHYVCDGWVDDISYINIDTPQYGEFHTVMKNEKNTFLDELFYNTKATLVNYSSVQKASAFFQTCYDSTLDIETAGKSQFVAQLINETTFFSSFQWDSTQEYKFRNVITYLTQINFNPFFILASQSKKYPKFIQNIDFWQSAETFNASDFIELFNTSQLIADQVQQFTYSLLNISTINDPRYAYYPIPSKMQEMSVKALFSDISLIFGSNEVLDYGQLIYDAYGISKSDTELTHFQYYEAGLSYFQNLATLIKQTNPFIVQYFIWNSILYYYFDFNQILSQSRYNTRSYFCFDKTKTAFPFVYGYVLFNKMYNNDTYNIASALATSIKTDGTQVLIENATWLDAASKAAALKKIENMKLYIGFPAKIKDGNNIDIFYKDVKQSMEASWVDNIASLTNFDFQHFNQTFWGKQYNLTTGWSEVFSMKESYDSWLTGINAFYYPLQNWFTIPVSISQPPFLDSALEYPSSVTFGGLGAVCGHEMSHGFDPQGSMYNYNGTLVGSIFTDYSRDKYSDKMECFVKQYDKIGVDVVNGTKIYVNGTFTITENVADNAGVWASWTAWRKYIKEKGNDKSLYGISLTQEQLFWVGFGRLWCESSISGYKIIPGDVHSANYARVIGALQNNPHFADAFSCDVGTRMNPKDKCIVW